MKRFIAFLFMAFLAYSSAQSCDNPLLKVYGLEGLDSPVSGAGLLYCGNLQNGQTCCSNATVVQLQVMLNNVTSTLQALAGERDIYIAQLDHNYTSQFQDKVSDLTDLTDEISDIQKDNAEVGDPIHTQFLSLRQLGSELNDISDDDTFKKDFIDMQNKRVTCFTTLLQIQAEAYCLACDPNWATQGVSTNGSITSASALCTTIQDACAPYTAAMDKFNPLFQAQQAYQRLVDLINYLKVYHEHKSIINATISDDIPTYTNATQRTNSEPTGCDEDSCTWQCSNLFNGSFVMNTSIVGNGGGVIGMGDIAYPDLGVTQILANGSSGDGTGSSSRRLQSSTSGTWNPDLTSSQMTITVTSDPAAVTNLDGESSASDADIDPHLGGSRTGLGIAFLVILVNIALSLIM